MLVLAVDTSGMNGSIALARCGPGPDCEVVDIVNLEGGTFSAQLVPQIVALLAKYSFDKLDLGGFSVVSGPGSFTGLRVGLAVVKALAEVLNKPVAAVSLLEAIVFTSPTTGRVVVALDAGRSEVYAGEYEVNEAGAQLHSERLLSNEDLIASAAGAMLITTDHIIAEGVRAKGLQVEEIGRPRSDSIACLGWRKILSGKTVSSDELDANYLRRSTEIVAKSAF